MRAVIATLMLAMTVLGGCAEIDAEANAAEPTMDAGVEPVDQSVQKLSGQFIVNFDNDTYGGPFNVTLDYMNDNSTNLTQMAWTIEFTHIGNMSVDEYEASKETPVADDADDNATAADGNATVADGNATVADGNATAADGNATVSDANITAETTRNVTIYEGIGLPFVLDVNLTEAGNYTVYGVAEFAGAYAEMMSIGLAIVSGVEEIIDPCLGVHVQDAISMSGQVLPGAAGSGFYTPNPFDVAPCQKGMVIDVAVTGAADITIRLVTPDGTQPDHDVNLVGGETMTFAPAGGLTAGAHDAQVRPYATVAGTYEMTITFLE